MEEEPMGSEDAKASGVRLRLQGKISLRQDYPNKKEVSHYAVLCGRISSEGGNLYSPNINVEIPITKTQYDTLKTKLDDSKAEEPVIRIDSGLELLLGFVTFN